MTQLGKFKTSQRLGRVIIATELCEGSVYFMLQYVDDALSIPIVETVVFIGKNVYGDGEKDNFYYFQDVESFKAVGAYPDNSQGEGNVFSLPEKAVATTIFTLDSLVDELGNVIARRMG